MDNMNRNVWEGWTPQKFVNELQPVADMIMSGHANIKPFTSKKQLADWCKNEQPYYKKTIPEVVNYFAQRYNLK